MEGRHVLLIGGRYMYCSTARTFCQPGVQQGVLSCSTLIRWQHAFNEQVKYWQGVC